MMRNSEGMIELTDSEAQDIADFIRRSLDRAWDRHTDTFICTESWEDGMRRMDPEMYDLADALNSI